MSHKKITGVVLAGGKNSRMGSDKGMLDLNGKFFVERIIDALKMVTDDIIIVSNGKNYDRFGYQVYKDIFKECGPMGGIFTALQYSKTDQILVISCDMPFVSVDILRALIERSGNSEIIIPEHGNGEEPLCAIYSRSCMAKLEAMLQKGEWKMKEALNNFKVSRVKFMENEFPDICFLNINTPGEYQAIIRSGYEYSN